MFPFLAVAGGIAAANAAKGLLQHKPKAPGLIPYQPEGYFDYYGGKYHGEGYKRTMGIDEAAYQALMRLSQREPGYQQDEIDAMLNPTIEGINTSAQSNIRRINRSAAGSGAYGGGGRDRAYGDVLQGASNARAGARWNTLAEAARVALQDRYSQIAALQGYADPRLQMLMGEHGRRLGYNSSFNNAATSQWATKLGQYNAEKQQGLSFLAKIASAYGGGGATSTTV